MMPAARDRVPGPGSARIPVLLSLLLLLPAAPAVAQQADFLFGRPSATLAFTVGMDRPGEDSDLFSFSREQLTLRDGAFSSPLLGAEVGLTVLGPLDVALGLDYAGRTVPSEMRDWVTQDDQPITQSTVFKRWRLTAGLKVYALSRGRQISDHAWIPASWSPFVGAGLGMTWYEFTQRGDFVDYETLDIFADEFTSRGSGATPWVSAGVDVTLTPYFILRTELRHLWGTGTVDGSTFQGFDPIDLSGFRATIGVAFRTAGRTI